MDTWRKSSYSNSNGGSCVEVAGAPGKVGVRDTTQARMGDARTVLAVTPGAWRKLITALR
jgi:hypothetical protein